MLPTETEPLPVQRAGIGRASRRAARTQDPADAERVVELKRRYTADKLADYISRVVDEAPPLTPEQRDRLAGLLRGGGDTSPAIPPDQVTDRRPPARSGVAHAS